MWAQIKGWFSKWRSGAALDDGEWGERCAADFLRANGLQVVARNWRNPKDRREEIDLVCRDRDIVVFVEVKTRSADALVPGYFAVNRRKKTIMLRACRAYLGALRTKPRTHRFDVVEVNTRGRTPPEILHFENVPLFP